MGVLSDTDEIAGELYLVPPARFVAARDELVRQARAAGNRELARELHSLRRPTQSAWLVNLLARHERALMERFFALGREFRQAQTRLDGARLQRLSAQRHEMIGDLIQRARGLAADAGLRPHTAVLAEAEETLRAGLVDLAAASTVMSGRLLRPLSHSGFGPMPHLEAPSVVRTAPSDVTGPGPGYVPGRSADDVTGRGADDVGDLAAVDPGDGREWTFWPVEHGPGGQPQAGRGPGRAERPTGRRIHVVPEPTQPLELAPSAEDIARRAREHLAAAESLHARRQQELGEAEAAVLAARDRMEWLNRQQIEAGREKVVAERHCADAKLAERAAAHAAAEARRAVEDASGAQ